MLQVIQATADIETVGISVGSLVWVRLFSCHDFPSPAVREINSRGRLDVTENKSISKDSP